MVLLSATNLSACLFPAAFSLGRPPLLQPFWAARALDGRKELLVAVALLLVLPSHASVAVLVGRGCGRRWAHGGRSSRGKQLKDESVIEMESVCRHY